ncbi:hypothetical protein BP6252_11008 [Coleophoma cylindrospora]|uniref:Azaphilone pigments biosynthesis cluster protein L N-terminal domain-containing protein n=1 Tax=Coleophoma cylindrospora TaxID=1849047 RepID=A0A3D8QNR1_9HELO|nr:hypothetical protein BP6252_11008 [Coleophoma cylindrospora]
MDPLSVTASIVGILTAAQQVSSCISNVVSKAKKAPDEMLELKNKVDNLYTVLYQLQLILLGRERAQQSRTTLILVDQVMVSLCACVAIFSKLNTFVVALENDAQRDLVERIRWALKADDIKEYITKLERQENSLSLMLTILTCESNFEAKSAVSRLELAVNALLQSHEQLLQQFTGTHHGAINPPEEVNEDGSMLSGSSSDETSSLENVVRVFAFQDDLDSSRVYRRIQRTRIEGDETYSIHSKTNQTMAWSMMSGMSLSEISNIGVLHLPLSKDEISNNELYRFGDVNTTNTQPSSLEKSNTSNNRRKTFLASNEYCIGDWNIKIKIGPHGVINQLLSVCFGHQDLIWVVPCVGGIEYPIDSPAEPITVLVAGQSIEVKVQYHVVENITWILLDSPITRQQTKSTPYPDPDDPSSAHFYSLWNQSIAMMMQRFDFDNYLVFDYRSALALLYLLPKTVPCVFIHSDNGPKSVFNLGWDVQSEETEKELSLIFGLGKWTVQQYLLLNSKWNLLFMMTRYLVLNQNGKCYVSFGEKQTYNSKSQSHKTIALAGINEIAHLPGPDPTDTAPVDESPEKLRVRNIDTDWESRRPELRKQLQEWAGLDINPNAEVLVFIGRWMYEKGIDLIPAVMQDLLAENDAIQLICLGPIMDEYGADAARRLDELMVLYPNRVFSKPEFITCPPCLFSGSEFALIPSRYEPYGLAGIEFCRKGSLPIGAKIGGNGRTPGFWYSTKIRYTNKLSTETAFLQRRLKKAIREATTTKLSERQAMRAAGVKARFPLTTWIGEIVDFQSDAIHAHSQVERRRLRRFA